MSSFFSGWFDLRNNQFYWSSNLYPMHLAIMSSKGTRNLCEMSYNPTESSDNPTFGSELPANICETIQFDANWLVRSFHFTRFHHSNSFRKNGLAPFLQIFASWVMKTWQMKLAGPARRSAGHSSAHDWRQTPVIFCLWVLNFWPKMPFWTSNQHKWHSQNQFCNEMKAGNIWKTKHMMLVCWCSSTSHLAPVHLHIFFKMFKPHMNNFKKDLTCVSPACKKSTSVGWGWLGLWQSVTLGTRRTRHRPLRS